MNDVGIAMTRASDISTDLVSSNQISDYSFFREPFTLDPFNVILRCATGLGPTGSNRNTVLGGWYLNGIQIPAQTNQVCSSVALEVRGATVMDYPGLINLYLCRPFTIAEEGIFECRMMNSSMMEQIMRVGVYFSGRSELLDMYPHHFVVNYLSSLYTAAPVIDPSSSSTVTIVVGSPLTLSCTSRGSPPDTFTWRKGSGPIVQSTSITTLTYTDTSAVFRAEYSINSVTTSDSGTYTCTMTNPIGSGSETITVDVGR